MQILTRSAILFTLAFQLSCSQPETAMTVVFTGDVILDRGVEDEMRLYGDSLLVNSVNLFSEGDFMVINYEGTFTSSEESKIDKYNFKTAERNTELLAEAGVTQVSVANNHSFDFGKKGFTETIRALKSSSLVPIGEDCTPRILKKGKYKTAILAASLTTDNDWLCISDIEKLKESVAQFERETPEVPLVLYLHWGLELQKTPEVWQQSLAADLLKLGADAIIGHHPHVTQTIEFIDGKPVLYSLGNFVADAYLPNTDKAYTAELKIADGIETIRLQPIKLQRYFPVLIGDERQQIEQLKSQLEYSNEICAIQQGKNWEIKPTAKVNFHEETSLWLCANDDIITTVKRLKSGAYVMTAHQLDESSNAITLHGELSEFRVADINNDGFTDLLLGVSKKVHFDPVQKKRINIYTLKNGKLKALWLGTRFIYDVESFDVMRTGKSNYLSTIEVDKNGNRFEGIYEWDNFGFGLIEMNQIDTNENYH